MAFLQLFRMVKLIICLSQSHKTYAKSMMMQILILMYQKEKNLPSWQMFMGSSAVFNEEALEMSFSVLSRCLGDTTKMMFEHMSSMYKLTGLYAETTDVLRTELGRVRKQNGYYSLDNKVVEVQTVVTFMQESIRALKFNVFRHFTGPLKNDNPAYIPGSGQSEVYKSDKVMWIKDVKDIATSWMYKYEASYSGTWAKDSGLHKILPLYDNAALLLSLGHMRARMRGPLRSIRAEPRPSACQTLPHHHPNHLNTISTPPTIPTLKVAPMKKKKLRSKSNVQTSCCQ